VAFQNICLFDLTAIYLFDLQNLINSFFNHRSEYEVKLGEIIC